MRLYYYTCLDPKMCPASSPKAYQQLGELDLPGPSLVMAGPFLAQSLETAKRVA